MGFRFVPETRYNDGVTYSQEPATGLSMWKLSSLEQEVAELITQSLHLDTIPGAIDPTQPLYGEGLGLDSIDFLELSVAISKTYGFQIKSTDPENARIFSSLRELTRTIESRRTK